MTTDLHWNDKLNINANATSLKNYSHIILSKYYYMVKIKLSIEIEYKILQNRFVGPDEKHKK